MCFVRQLLVVAQDSRGWGNLSIVQVLPATHHQHEPGPPATEAISTDGGAVTMSVPGLIGTRVRLFSGGLMDRSSKHPDSLVASHMLTCCCDAS